MSKDDQYTSKQHAKEARKIMAEANKLKKDKQNDWACVAYFYSSYRYVRAAHFEDPLFRSVEKCKLIHPKLKPSHKYIGKHHDRSGLEAKTPGINDFMSLVYPSIAVEYELLHISSIEVRYKLGTSMLAEDASIYAKKIESEYINKNLRHD